MNRAELQELIDVCRTEEDLRLPEMKSLAEQIAADPSLRRSWDLVRRQDSLVRGALLEVDLPRGLEQRILDRLASGGQPASDHSTDEQRVTAEPVDGSAVDLAGGPEVDLAGGPLELARSAEQAGTRRWSSGRTILVACAATAALLLCVVSFWHQREKSMGDEIELVRNWMNLLDESKWSLAPPPARFTRPKPLQGKPQRWQALAKLQNSLRVVCYELSTEGSRSRSYLFVALAKPQAPLPNSPPNQPYPISPWSIGAWQSQGVVYILITEGGLAEYQRLLRLAPTPFAVRQAGGSGGKSCLSGKA